MESPLSSQPYSANGVAPTFVKCLHDVSTLKGQLVVLECRLRGTPPLQVMWSREEEDILDSDDFRILRKKASSAPVPEELCTLVITEAFPEDSGLFKCTAVNPFGSISCSALLEVYHDAEEQLESEFALGQEKEAGFLPPPPADWPDNSDAEDGSTLNVVHLPQPLLQANHSALEPLLRSVEDSLLSSEGQSPSKLSFNSPPQEGPDSMNLSDLPTYKPGAFPPSSFNYERPRHFIQSQRSFQAPSYESSQDLPSSPDQASCNQVSYSPHAVAETLAQSRILSGQSSQMAMSRSQAVARPLLPSRGAQQLPCISPPALPRSPFSPIVPAPVQAPPPAMTQNMVQPTVVSMPSSYKGSPAIFPKPILKKKLSYEERIARRLLGPDNASYMSDQDSASDGQPDQTDFPEGRHTGGLWGKHHSGTDERGAGEGSSIQEKCYLPRFLQIPSDLTVGGLPGPDVAWYLDGKAIRPDDYHKMLVCEKGMHSFIIEIVTAHHAGVYECVAHNRAGESRFTLRLDVIAQELLRPPSFTQKMQNSRALEGDTVRMECKVDASPPPQLFWKKDKDMLRLDPNRMSLYQDGSGRQCLLIERLTKADAGWYTLSAINEAGMSTCN
ncbi:hypothetical protein NHX12_012052, partial [Muraenolepis orangiensis]